MHRFPRSALTLRGPEVSCECVGVIMIRVKLMMWMVGLEGHMAVFDCQPSTQVGGPRLHGLQGSCDWDERVADPPFSEGQE